MLEEHFPYYVVLSGGDVVLTEIDFSFLLQRDYKQQAVTNEF